MTQFANNMQQKMNAGFREARITTMKKNASGKAIDAMNRIEARASVKGCNAREVIADHSFTKNHKNNDGHTIIGVAVGVPGLSEVQDTALDVAENIVGDRRATYETQKISSDLSPKQEREIREANEEDLQEFLQATKMFEQLELLEEGYNYDATSKNTNGEWYAIVDTAKDEIDRIEFREKTPCQAPKPQLTAEQKQLHELQVLAWGTQTAPKPAYA